MSGSHSVRERAARQQHRLWSKAQQSYAQFRFALAVRAEAQDNFHGAIQHLRVSAIAGMSEAQYRLATFYERGKGIIRSPADAAAWYRRAAAQGHSGAEFALSLMYLHGQHVPRTKAWYRAATRSDESAAARNRETLFPHGIEISQDYAEALRWSLAAAHKGRIEAQANAGLLLLQGLGCEADYAEALRWLSAATDNQNAEAQYGMGMLYAGGLGVAADMAEACRWYEAAAAQNHSAAQAALGYIYGFGEEGRRQPERAKALLRRASGQRHAAAPYYLGLLLLGDGHKAFDAFEVEGSFLRAAQRGYVPAMLALGNLYASGACGKATTDKAVIWYRAAADTGDAEAQFQLGALYADSSGPRSDPATALQYYRQAADQGHQYAQHNCAELLLRSGQDRAAAFWFKAASAQGFADSQLMLGDLYATGRGVHRSLANARDWYERAAGNGLKHAALKLERTEFLLRSPAPMRGAAEPVHVVVWNLDDPVGNAASRLDITEHIELLASLAKRGIVSLLRGSDSLPQVQQILVPQDVWEYFVFALPNDRVTAREIVSIIGAALIPPGNVLLIDDHPTNQIEAAEQGLQVAGSSIAPHMLDDPRFARTDDPTLTQAVRLVLLGESSVTQAEEDTTWYRVAAEAGNAEAQSILGWALLTGDDCEADAVSAFTWFMKSAQTGFVPAQLQLGIMYRDGVGVAADESLALEWLTRASEGGNADARSLLETPSAQEFDVEQDSAEDAVPWYRVSAEAGDPEAQNILAWACLTGDKCEKDEAVAAFWFEKSAKAGFVPAQSQLGSMYYEGLGVPQRYALAVTWFRRAAELGDSDAQFRLANMLWRGDGIESNKVAAMDWYRRAAESGNREAQAFIATQSAESGAAGPPVQAGDTPTAVEASPQVPLPQSSAVGAEAVRLLIWDLDDSFWRGTLVEGGIEAYIQENHDLVVALAERGIMSSICSRNDYVAVQGVLEERGLWQYFIFPSIDWTPKGARVAAIVDAAQLRPPTVLFIDDNPLNCAAVAAAVPGIQIAGPDALAGILDTPPFKGKHDRTLSRLAQYKLLEKRQVDRQSTEGGDEEFLRAADIRAIIDTDVAANLDRAIELINRTNQLNFTKRRLPESAAAARAQLLTELSPYYTHAGLIRVIDKYGDYGHCGYFRLEGDTLVDYCFSCRILGMGVESWLYERLGRPPISAVGEALIDLTQPRRVDWVRLVASDGSTIAVAERSIPEVRLRGGCDLDAVAHYFRLVAKNVNTETNRTRAPLFVRMDTTAQLVPALDGITPTFREAASRLGFAADDFDSQFLAPAIPGTVLVYSPWGDISQALYRHKSGGFRIPVNVHIHEDLTRISADDLSAALGKLKLDKAQRAEITSIVAILRSEYKYEFHTPVRVAVEIIRRLFERIPEGARLFFILPHEWYKEGDHLLPRAVEYNRGVRALASEYPAVTLMSMNDIVHGAGDMQDSFDHFDRVVYFRLYQKIMQAIGKDG
jgi:FkbH-like protein